LTRNFQYVIIRANRFEEDDMATTNRFKTSNREIPLGSVRLVVTQANVNINDVYPNPNQPRYGAKDDAELRRSIEENGGIFIPLLVEPHPEHKGKYQIIDGERRWLSLKNLAEGKKDGRFKIIPVEVTDRTLEVEERLRAWVYIHQQRKEWTVKEKERTAYKLIQIVGRVSAASILGISVKEVDALKEIFELSEEITGLSDPDASISYAREIRKIATHLRPPDVEKAIISKINKGLVKTSKEIRSLRKILRNDAARAEFMKEGSSVTDALTVVGLSSKEEDVKHHYGRSIAEDLNTFSNSLSKYSWRALKKINNKEELLNRIEQCQTLLAEFKEVLR
jgi:ParB family chromosome partitioning protein